MSILKKAALAGIAAAGIVFPLAGETLAPEHWSLSGADAAQSSLEADGEALKVNYRFSGTGSRHQLYLAPKKIPVLATEAELLRLRVFNNSTGHRLYFECVDRDGETLLYSYASPKRLRTLDAPGEQEFVLRPVTDRRDAWGGSPANKRPDFPLRMVRIWLDPTAGAELSGTLSLTGLETGPAETPAAGSRFPSLEQAQISVLAGDARFRRQGAELELELRGPGFPGVRLEPQSGVWDCSGVSTLLLDVENLSETEQVEFHMRINSVAGAQEKERSVYTAIALNPREKRQLELYLPHVEPRSRIRFSSRLKGAPEGVDKAPNLFADRITQITLYTQYPHKTTTGGTVRVRVGGLRPGKPSAPSPAPLDDPERFFPFVDAFGQYVHADWPEKIKGPGDLERRREAEAAALAERGRIPDWNRYGGWEAGPQLAATGAFRTEKYRGKWFLVDPEGKLFLSHGVNAIVSFDDFRVPDPAWFAAGAPASGSLDFVRANLLRKYGEPLHPGFSERTSRRLEAWGLNTIGGWSEPALCRAGGTPYTAVLFDNGRAPRIGPKFYDPFDPAFRTALEENLRSEKFSRSIDDPWCIGYFVGNELEFGRHAELAEHTLRLPPEAPARQALRRFLAQKYRDVSALNRSWGTSCASWDAFAADAAVPRTEAAKRDLEAFSDILTEEFFRVCRDTLRQAAPGRLFLGSRFNGRCHPDMPYLFRIAAKYCDAVSFNSYSNSMAQYMLRDLPDIPLLVGEFSFNVRGRGMLNDALRTGGVTQRDRARAYLRFMEGALTHPNIVGAHWFTWVDQPLTGRFDGENYQFGVVDTADTPYEELTGAMRLAGERMYEYRLNGKLCDISTFNNPAEQE